MTVPDAQRGADASSAAAAPSPAAPSLTRHLIAWVLGALIVVWVSFMVVGYRTGQIVLDGMGGAPRPVDEWKGMLDRYGR